MIQHLEGDCRAILPTLPAKSVQCCLSSPPFWSMRSYLPHDHPRKDLEIGREETVQEYIETLVTVFREVSRVLMNDGTLWLNMGDTYADKKPKARAAGVKIGDLIGLPWRLAFALQADGWYVRSDTIWNKPNPLPEGGVTNRPTKAHEYLFLLTRKQRYFYDADAIREPVTSTGGASFGKQRHSTEGTGAQSRRLKSAAERNHPLGKNKRSVWTVPVRSFHGAHFAVFPANLIKPCILAGCPPGQSVLDPFAGSGTTGVVAEELGRNAILIELNPVYVEMQKERTKIKEIVAPPQVSTIDAERAERIAEKRNQKLREKMPLFADQMEEITGVQVKAAADRHAEAFAQCEQELQARGDAFREQVRQVVSAETITALDQQRERLPNTAEYHADFWRQQWQRIESNSIP